jgi:cell division septal protein FtsQ
LSRVENLKKKRNGNATPSPTLVYSRTEKEKPEKRHLGVFGFFAIFILCGVGYLLLFSGLFDIKNINVIGYSHPDVITGIAREEVGQNIFSKNILFFNMGELRKTLAGDPRIINIKINRKFPNDINITADESKPAIIWSAAGENFLLDDRGAVIGEAKNENLPTVFDASNINVKPGERVASPTFIKFISDIFQGFEPSTGVKISKATIFDLLTDVHILSSDGWTVYLDATKSSDAQLKNLTRVLAEAKKDSKKLEYIDMRLDNKIFYK